MADSVPPEGAAPLWTDEGDPYVRFYYVDTTVADSKPYAFYADIYEVSSWSMDDHVPLDSELYLKVYIKWDGCSHFWFGEQEGYIHVCGMQAYDDLVKVVETVKALAATKIARWDPCEC